MSIEMYHPVYSVKKHRKDHYGRNTVLKSHINGLGFDSDKNYLDMDIHERINVRSVFRGYYHPSACIKNKIMHDRYPFLIYEDIDLFTIVATSKKVKLYNQKKYL